MTSPTETPRVTNETPVRTVRVPAPLWQAAKTRAAERGETVTDVIIRALTRYVKPRKDEAEL